MKTKILTLSAILCLGLIFQGCEKEEDSINTQQVEESKSSNAKSSNASYDLVDAIKLDASKKIKSMPDPANPSNSYDDYGVYYQNMILYINNSEISDPSSSSSDYQAKYEDYLIQTPYQGSFPTIDFQYTNLFVEITELIIEYSTEESVNDAINGLLAVENNISSSGLLTNNQKIYLLSLSASLKYSRYTIAEYGLTIDGITVAGDEGLKLSADCFDQAFSDGVHAVYSNFVDTDNPGNMVAAWGGFVVTIAAGIGNGFYRGIKDC